MLTDELLLELVGEIGSCTELGASTPMDEELVVGVVEAENTVTVTVMLAQPVLAVRFGQLLFSAFVLRSTYPIVMPVLWSRRS